MSNQPSLNYAATLTETQLRDAITAVLEIHNPEPSPYKSNRQRGKERICRGCGNSIDGYAYYPCKTVLAITGDPREML